MKIKNYVRFVLSVSLKVFILVICLFFTEGVFAQVGTPAYLNATSTTSNTIPLNMTSSVKAQWIYAPNAFTTLGGGTGTPAPGGMAITKIYIKFSSAVNATNTYPDFTISLGQNLGTQANWGTTSNTAYPFTTGLTSCFYQASGFAFTGIVANAWYGVTLQIPFNYDPSLSLIVEVKSTNSVAGGNSVANASTTGIMQRVYGPNAATTGTSNTGLTPMGFDLTALSGCTSPPLAGSATASPSTPVCITNQVQLNLTGNSTGSGQTYQWESSPDIGFTTPTNVGSSQNFAGISINASATLYYRCQVTCSTSTQPSAPVLVTVTPPLPAGTYTINSALPTSGTNYQTFGAVASVLACGIAGPVVFNVDAASGPYVEQVTFPVIGGVSGTNTVTINGNNRIIQFTPVTANRHVIKLDGTDYLTLNNLEIRGLATDFDYGIHLINGADNNTINGCTIDISPNTSTTQSNSAGIVASGSTTSVTTAGNANNNTFSNNIIRGGYQGIILTGAATSLNILNNRILNNQIFDTYANGIDLTQNDGTLVKGNDISRPTKTTMTTSAGIELSTGCKNVVVDGNKIHDTHNLVILQTGTSYGISLASCDAPAGSENKVINNIIYRFNALTGTQYGLYNTGSDGVYYYHNTVVLDNAASTSGTTYAFYQTTEAVNIIVKDNIFYVTRAGTGTKNCMRFGTSTSIFASDNNVLYMNSPAGTNGVAFYVSNFITLADWQAAFSQYDLSSVSVNPAFVDPTSPAYNFTPTAIEINSAGSGVGVLADILGNIRSTSVPDPGAYEFTPTGTDAKIVWVSPGLPISAGLKTIIVNVSNLKSTPISQLTIGYTDGGVPVIQNFPTVTIPPNGNQNFSFSVPYNLAFSANLRAFISVVNNVPDDIRANDTTLSQNLCLALSGTYSINSAVITGGSNFQSFNAFATALNCAGIVGPVVVNVAAGSGPYNEQVEFAQVLGASAVNTIIINGNGRTLTYEATISAAPGTLVLNGTDFMTVNNLNIVGTGATYAFACHLWNQADKNTFSGCTFSTPLTPTASTQSAFSISGSATAATTEGLAGSNNLITGCTMNGGYYNTAIVGNASLPDSGNQVINCSIRDQYIYGIYNSYNKGTVLSGNIIERPNRTTISTSFYGIYMTTGCTNFLVEKNRIRHTWAAAPASTGTQYSIYYTTTSTAGLENRIYNNIISDINFNGVLYGIYNTSGTFVKFYHNTISFDQTTATGTTTTYGIYNTSSSSTDFRNNIVSIKRGGTGTKTCLYYSTVPTTSNNNDLYIQSASGLNYVEYNGTTGYATLALWQAANITMDQQSKSANPSFLSPATGDYTPAAGAINNIGANLGITTDITGSPRGATPDPGAYEFVPPPLDGVVTWVAPVVTPFTPGLNTISVRVTNNAALPITNLDLEYTDGIVTRAQNFPGLNILTGANQVFNFTTQYNLTGSANLKGYIAQINGASDADQTNDTAYQTLCLGLSGNYTINSAIATAGTNFQTFTAAFARLASCGVTGPVTFNVDAASGPYVEQVTLPSIGGVTATNTITINGNLRTLQFTPVTGARHILKLDGADYVTINNLIIKGLAADFDWGVHLTNSANNNTFSGCTFDLSANTSTTQANSAGIVASNSSTAVTTTGNNASNLTVNNCSFNGGYTGVILVGLATSLNAVNNLITNNQIINTYGNGIELIQNDGALVRGNDISRPTRLTALSGGAGVEIGAGCKNVRVDANKIHDTHTLVTTQSGTSYGVFLSSCDAPVGEENKVTNNLIYNFNSLTGIQYGLYNSGSNGVFYYNNTVVLDRTASTAGVGYCFYQTTLATNIQLKNNIFYNTRGGTGNKNCIRFNTATTEFISDNNNFYFNAVGGTSGVASFTTSNYVSLADWQTANPAYDPNSFNLNPGFVLPSYANNNVLLDNNAIPLGLTNDVNGAIRSLTSPDIGAVESTLAPTPDFQAVSLVSPVISGCFSNAEPVVIRIKNNGNYTHDFSVTPVTITCNITGTITVTLTGTPTGTLISKGSMDVTLTGTANMSAPGNYVFNASTTIAGDINNANNGMAPATRTRTVFSAGVVSVDNDEICSAGKPVLTLTGSTGQNIQWQQSTFSPSGPWTDVGTNSPSFTPAADITLTTHYQVVATCLSSTLASNVQTVLVGVPELLTKSGAERCGIGPVTLHATANANSDVVWYSAKTGGVLLHTGNDYTVPALTDTTKYYMSASFGGFTSSVGLPVISGTTGVVATYYMNFTVFSTVTIKSVNAYFDGVNEAFVLNIRNAAAPNASVFTYSGTTLVSGLSTPQTIPINATLTAGTYQMGWTTNPGTYRQSNGATYPYTIPDVLSITGNTFSTTSYYYFYNWVIGSGCESPRDSVTAIFRDAPAITAAPSDTLVCPGSNITLSANSGLNPDYTYTWLPGNLTGSSVAVAPTANTIYTVAALDNTAGPYAGCLRVATVNVTTKPKVGVVASANPVSICSGDNSQLNATASTTKSYGAVAATTPSPVATPGSGITVIDNDNSPGNTGGIDDGYFAVNLPFDFSYFGQSYNKAYINNNGFVSFGSGYSGVPSNAVAVIPKTGDVNNAVYLAWKDWDLTVSGSIQYFTSGTAPHRVFVIKYVNVPPFVDVPPYAGVGYLNGQIELYEDNGRIKLFLTQTDASNIKTLGIENAAGTVAYSPSTRNGVAWSVSSAEQFDFNPTGGSLTYSWSPDGNLDNPASASPFASFILSNTIYTVSVTDATDGCTGSDAVAIVTGDPLVAPITASATEVCAGQPVTLSVSPTGGCSPYGYSWETDAGVIGTFPFVIVTPLVTTTYYLNVTDNIGNIYPQEVTITVKPIPTVSVTSGLICGSGSASLTASGALTYTWSPSNNLNTTTGATVISSTSLTRTYTVTGFNATGCQDTAISIVTVSTPTAVTASASVSSVGFNGSTQLTAIGSTGNPILISEITVFRTGTGATSPYPAYIPTTSNDLAEISNISNVPIDIGGYTWQDFTGTTMRVTYNFPAGTIIPANSVLVLALGNGTNDPANRFYYAGGTSNDAFSSGGAYGFLIKNGATIVDAVSTNAYAWPAISGITAADWTAPGATMTSGHAGVVRSVALDHNTGTDWTTSGTTPQSIGTYNGSYVAPPSTITYSWNPSAFLDNATSATPLASNMTTSTNYTVTAANSDGCSDTAIVPILVGVNLAVTASSSENNFCAGLSTNLTSTASAGCQPYASYWWSNGSSVVGTTAALTVTPPVGTTTYTVTATDACGSTATASVAVTVKPLPTVTVTKSGDICTSGTSVLTASGANSYAWQPSTNLNATTGTSVTATLTATSIFTVTGTGLNGCSSSANISVQVFPAITVSPTATPPTVCVNGNSELAANPATDNGYVLSSIAHNSIAPVGTPTTVAFTSTDESVTSGLPIPFAFNFFGTSYSTWNVSANGYVGFGTTTNTLTSQFLPSPTAPSNLIAICWADLNVLPGSGSTVTYFTSGTAPNRVFVISFNNIKFFTGSSGAMTGQIHLYEGSNAIEIHLTQVDHGTSVSINSMGIENSTGTVGYSPASRNRGAFWNISTPEAWRFVPILPTFTYSWTPTTFLNDPTIATPLASNITSSTTYQATVTNTATNCSGTASVTVTTGVPVVAAASVFDNAICAGESDSLFSAVSGGKAPYTYSWSDGTSVIGTSAKLKVIPSSTTTYTLTATDNCGLVSVSSPVTITVSPLPVIAISPPGGSICDGSPASITMTASGANTYAWSPSVGLNVLTGATVTAGSAANAATTTYQVTGTNTTTGCKSATSAIVYRTNFVTATATSTPGEICAESSSQLNALFTVKTNPALLITEVTQFQSGTIGATTPRPSFIAATEDDFVEISNLSDAPVNMDGLVFELWAGVGLDRTYTFPAGVILQGHSALVLHIGNGTDSPADNYYHTGGTDDPLSSSASYGYLLKSSGSILDAVASTNSGGNTYLWPLASGVTSGQWTGTIPFTGSNSAGIIRTSGFDSNHSDDWSYATNAIRQTLGEYNSYYGSNSQPNLNYSWSPATFLSDATLVNPIMTASASGTFNYVVTATDPASGCTHTANTSVSVTALPTLTMSGTNGICVGSSASLTLTFTGVAPFVYSYTDGTTVYGPLTTSASSVVIPVTPSAAPGNVITYTPTSISDSRCDGSASSLIGSAVITMYGYSSIAGITLTSNKPFENICTGDNITISMNGITPASLGYNAHWKWYTGSCTGGTPVPGSTDLTSITVSPTANTTYYVRAEGYCNTTSCVSLPVVVSTAPPSGNPGLAYAPTIAYAGASDSIRVNAVPGATFYHWTTNGNSNILFDGHTAPYESSSPSVTLTFISPATNGNGIGNYHIQFFAGNACGTTNSNNIRIRATVEAPSAINGPLVACSSQTKLYTVTPVVGAKSYQWSFQSGGGSISGNGTQSVNVTFTTLPAVLCVHGVTANGSAGPDYCINISTITATPGPISGNLTPCQGGSAVYSIDSVSGAVSYAWSTDIPGATIIGTTNSVTANFPSNTFSGNICVTAYSGCGTSLASCLPIVSGTVPPLGTITGPIDGVCNASSINYQVPSTGATTYNWTVPSGATIQPSTQGTNSILVDFTNSYAGGNITVVSTNICGIANGSLPVTGVPAPPIVTGSTEVCAGLTEGYTAASPGAISYSWNINPSEADIQTTSITGDLIILEWLTNGGTIVAMATNACGTSLPGSLVVGAGACRLTGQTSFVESLNAMVYPNPSQGRVTLQFTSTETAVYRMKIMDMTGREVAKENLEGLEGLNQHDINLGQAAKGVYMLTLENQADEKIVIRLVVE